MKMDPAKSGSLFLLWPPLAPFAKVWLRAKPIQNRSQNAKSPPLPSPTNLKCILRNAPIKPVIKCERVSRFLIKVDLVENWVAGRFVKTSLKLHQSRADAFPKRTNSSSSSQKSCFPFQEIHSLKNCRKRLKLATTSMTWR